MNYLTGTERKQEVAHQREKLDRTAYVIAPDRIHDDRRRLPS
jgi:hypothetical protein